MAAVCCRRSWQSLFGDFGKQLRPKQQKAELFRQTTISSSSTPSLDGIICSSQLPSTVLCHTTNTTAAVDVSSIDTDCTVMSCCWWHCCEQRRYRGHQNVTSLLHQHYNRLPISKKYRKAIRKGSLIWDKGQVKIPPISILGYDLPKKCQPPYSKAGNNIYKGKLENLRVSKIRFAD
eukprot:GHVS01006354.1.p1 GENE.GHVS01006354.1~~GHVS01006354.1.p1  ORF type:complete len:177 (-),score=22.28 GHVS01006354.1:30-560(-)